MLLGELVDAFVDAFMLYELEEGEIDLNFGEALASVVGILR
tara:strand:+ start:218 stop:340 length:123 start_codon:yes stop_codon:yes gene_type:complete